MKSPQFSYVQKFVESAHTHTKKTKNITKNKKLLNKERKDGKKISDQQKKIVNDKGDGISTVNALCG